MNLRKNIFILIVAIVIFASSCSSGPENTGREFMPDMGHSIAYEANVLDDYYYNTWDSASVQIGSGFTTYDLSKPKDPVKGTIARGYAGSANPSSPSGRGITVKPNGSVPYYYGDTEEERTRASNEIINNPYPITEAALADGKNLYNIFCATCHGEKGDGNGYLVRDDGGVYPAQPANLIDQKFIDASNGQYYHALIYGKNVMGGYSDKISYEERWNVLHYIRSLQAKELGLKYSEKVNTLNDTAVPGANKPVVAQVMEETPEEAGHGHDDDGGHEEGDHSHDGGDHDHN